MFTQQVHIILKSGYDIIFFYFRSKAEPKTGQNGSRSARMSASGYKKASRRKAASSPEEDSASDSIDSDEEEAFPPEGPFQCEICQGLNSIENFTSVLLAVQIGVCNMSKKIFEHFA